MIARFAILFFFTMGLLVIPLLIALLCRWLLPKKIRYYVILVCTLLIWGAVAYGFFVGFAELEVNHVEYASDDLPAAFDGYRIVQFSDAHVGTYDDSNKWLLQQAVDSINAQQPDVIVFTGDLQNLSPCELPRHAAVLRQLRAKDGIFSVMGNHDYPVYLDIDEQSKTDSMELTERTERQLGWQLLLNENSVIRRDSDSIVIAGMENWGKVKRMPRLGDVKKTLAGLNCQQFTTGSHQPFIVMLQHDPSAWHEKILPECHAQLTLSGHTHGGQFSLFGWSPVALSYKEWGGTTYEGSRAIHVSTGLGGLIPFRLNMPGEIVVITLKVKK